MRHRLNGDAGVTLIELLLAAVIGTMVMGATLMAVVVGFRSTDNTSEKLNESHDAQLVETYLPQDLQSATTVLLGPQGTGCAGGGGGGGGVTNRNLITLQWGVTEQAAPTNYSVSYRIFQAGTGFKLIRIACSGPGSPPNTAPKNVIVGHDLLDLNDPRWAANPPTTCGSRVTVPIIEASGYMYTVTGNSRTGITGTTTVCPSGSSTTTSPPETTTTIFDPEPLILELDMRDTNTNGRIDQVVARFNKNLPAACGTASNPQAATYWSVANPVLAVGSVVVSGVNATLNLVEGAVDTGLPNLQVTFAPAAGCAVQPFANEHPIDQAAPVVMSVVSLNAGAQPGDGQMALNDQLVITLSEHVNAPPSASVNETQGGNGNQPDTINIPGITNGAQQIGTGYFNGNNNSVNWAATITTPGTTISIQLTGNCSGNCNRIRAGQGSWNFVPAAGLNDGALVPNAVINPSALPGPNFKVF